MPRAWPSSSTSSTITWDRRATTSGNSRPYFTDRYVTPWGPAINYDGPESDEVRLFVISNALYWASEYHMDGLRFDAVQGMIDFGARHILAEVRRAVGGLAEAEGRTILVIAESDLNDPRIIDPPESGGYGLDAQWNDDFHHSLHALLTGERSGYYEDFGGIRAAGQGGPRGFRLQRPVFPTSPARPRKLLTPFAALQVHRLLPKSRPGGKQGEGREARLARLL